MTFLQLSTAYRNPSLGGKAVGWFSSGTGAAGLVGALIWWLVRGLGVELGLGFTAVIPPCMSLTYFFLLPMPSSFQTPETAEYAPVPTGENNDQVEDELDEGQQSLASGQLTSTLTTREKLALARPLVLPYMIPLFAVYFGMDPPFPPRL
jgi:battenin